MGVPSGYPLSPPLLSEEQQDHNMNLSMLYYSFFVVATAGVLLAVYHCLIVNWCTRSSLQSNGGNNVNAATLLVQSSESLKVMELESNIFKYRKSQDNGGMDECVVCLSAYEDGEDVRQLLRCNHCFHAPCIDMWLYSHYECPLCREPVGNIKGILPQSGSSIPRLMGPVSLV